LYVIIFFVKKRTNIKGNNADMSNIKHCLNQCR